MAENDDHKNYKTGYKQPPKGGQFKKGQSGNPRGRPRKRKYVEEEIRTRVHEEEMGELITVRDKDGREERISARRLLYRKLKHEAFQKSDIKALKELLRLEKEHAAFVPDPGEWQGGVLLIPQPVNANHTPLTAEQWAEYYGKMTLDDVLKEQKEMGLKEDESDEK